MPDANAAVPAAGGIVAEQVQTNELEIRVVALRHEGRAASIGFRVGEDADVLQPEPAVADGEVPADVAGGIHAHLEERSTVATGRGRSGADLVVDPKASEGNIGAVLEVEDHQGSTT